MAGLRKPRPPRRSEWFPDFCDRPAAFATNPHGRRLLLLLVETRAGWVGGRSRWVIVIFRCTEGKEVDLLWMRKE
jgi:hypothetical protein